MKAEVALRKWSPCFPWRLGLGWDPFSERAFYRIVSTWSYLVSDGYVDGLQKSPVCTPSGSAGISPPRSSLPKLPDEAPCHLHFHPLLLVPSQQSDKTMEQSNRSALVSFSFILLLLSLLATLAA